MLQQTPSISIIVASYNYERYLYEAIESILLQSWQDFELLIVDDGSIDASVDVAYSFAARDSRITVLQHPDKKNHGLQATLQLGIAKSKGNYITFLEADDIWSPHCLQQRMIIASETDAGVIFNNVDALCMEGVNTAWFDVYVPRIMKGHSRRIAKAQKGPYGPYEMRGAFLIENQIPTFSSIMFKREVLLPEFLDSPVPYWLDRWILCQVAQQTNFAFLPEKLTYWRLHSKSFTERNRPTSIKKDAFTQYIKSNTLFWKSLRQRLIPHYTQDADWLYRCFLRLPVWAEFMARLIVHMKDLGIQSTITNIIKKF